MGTELAARGVETVECYASRTVEVIGVEALTSARLSPNDIRMAGGIESLELDLTREQAERIADAFFDCGFSAADLFASSGSAAHRDCVDSILDEAELGEAIAAGLTGDVGARDSTFDAMFAAISTECPGR